jgi:hypothetical protein
VEHNGLCRMEPSGTMEDPQDSRSSQSVSETSIRHSLGFGIVAEYVGIHLLLNPGAASGVLAGVTRCFGIHGLITTMPAVSGEEPNGFFAQAPPVCTEFIEQNRTEHHVAVFATLAGLDVDHHPSAINVADLQASQLRVPNAGSVEGHEDRSMKWCAGRIDELRHFFLTENRGHTTVARISLRQRKGSTYIGIPSLNYANKSIP